MADDERELPRPIWLIRQHGDCLPRHHLVNPAGGSGQVQMLEEQIEFMQNAPPVV